MTKTLLSVGLLYSLSGAKQRAQELPFLYLPDPTSVIDYFTSFLSFANNWYIFRISKKLIPAEKPLTKSLVYALPPGRKLPTPTHSLSLWTLATGSNSAFPLPSFPYSLEQDLLNGGSLLILTPGGSGSALTADLLETYDSIVDNFLMRPKPKRVIGVRLLSYILESLSGLYS